MTYKNFVKMPPLAALREALQYEPSDKRQPLLCITPFEGTAPGARLGFKASGNWLVKVGAGTTYLRKLVWLVVEGSIPSGYSVDCAESNNNRIENLYLRNNKSDAIRLPKSVPPESLIPIPHVEPVAPVEAAAKAGAARTHKKQTQEALIGNTQPRDTQPSISETIDTPPWLD